MAVKEDSSVLVDDCRLFASKRFESNFDNLSKWFKIKWPQIFNVYLEKKSRLVQGVAQMRGAPVDPPKPEWRRKWLLKRDGWDSFYCGQHPKIESWILKS